MNAIVTASGQIVIPPALRRKYGFTDGAQVRIVDEGDHIALRPAAKPAYLKLRGSLQGKGVLQILISERAKDRARE